MSYHTYPFQMERYPGVVGAIKDAKHQQDDMIVHDVLSENQCLQRCHDDVDCKLAVWKYHPDGGVCTHQRKDTMYDIQEVEVVYAPSTPDHVTHVKPECHEQCRTSLQSDDSPFVVDGVCTRWLCDHGSCGERRHTQYLDCNACASVVAAENRPSDE